MSKKMMRLQLDTEIKMLRGAPPPEIGEKGPRPMTIGDVFVRIAQECGQRDEANAMRVWNIGSDIARADKEYIDLTELDFEMFHNACKSGERPNWAKVNIANAFNEAKEVGNK